MVDYVTVDSSILKGIETPYERDAKLAAINNANQTTANLRTADDTAQNALYQSQNDYNSVNAMRQAIRDNPDKLNDSKFLAGLGGYKGGSEFMKARADYNKTSAEAGKLGTENESAIMELSRNLNSAYAETPDGMAKALEASFRNPAIAAIAAKNGMTLDSSLRELHNVSNQGEDAWKKYVSGIRLGPAKAADNIQQKYNTDTTAKTALMGQLSTATTAANTNATERMKTEYQYDPKVKQDAATAEEKGKLIGSLGGPAAIRAKQQADIENTDVTLGQIDNLVGRPAVKDAQGNIISPEIPPHPGAKMLGNVMWLKLADSSLPSEAKDFKHRAEQLAANAAMMRASSKYGPSEQSRI
jgi:hypothetical protein